MMLYEDSNYKMKREDPVRTPLMNNPPMSIDLGQIRLRNGLISESEILIHKLLFATEVAILILGELE